MLVALLMKEVISMESNVVVTFDTIRLDFLKA